jgi:hypothetical protein
MLRDKEERFFRTALYALRITFTQIALKRNTDITMEEDGTKRARHHTLLAGNALFFINL